MYQHAVSILLLFSSSLSHLPSLWVMFLSTVQPLQKNKFRCSVDEPKKCSAKNTTHNVRTQSTNITHLNACIRSIPNVRPLCICFAPYFLNLFFCFLAVFVCFGRFNVFAIFCLLHISIIFSVAVVVVVVLSLILDSWSVSLALIRADHSVRFVCIGSWSV